MRTTVILFLPAVLLTGACTLMTLPAQAEEKTVQIFIDGIPTAVLVPGDFEMYEVALEDIDIGNQELLKLASIDIGGELATGYSHVKAGGNKTGAEKGGKRPSGVGIDNLNFSHEYTPANWFGVEGQYRGADSWSLALDQSNASWSLDSQSFEREGWVFGASSDAEDKPAFTASRRHRQQHWLRLRRGSMEGSSWLLDLRKYDVERQQLALVAAALQPRDVYLRSGRLSTRGGRRNTIYELSAEYGQYASKGSEIDNTYTHIRAEALSQLSPSLGLELDAALRSVDARLQDAEVGYSSAGAQLDWQAGHSVQVGAGLRLNSTANHLAANSNVRGFNEASASLRYRPDPDFVFSARLRQRDFNLERLKLEDAAFLELFAADPPSTRAELAQYREKVSSSSRRYDLDARWRVNCRLSLQASFGAESYNDLPGAAKTGAEGLEAAAFSRIALAAGTAPDPSYLPDERSWGDLRLDYEVPCGGRFSFITAHSEMRNTPRDSAHELSRYALNYSDALNDCQRWQAGVSRVESNVDLPEALSDWSAESWNYTLSLAGEGTRMNYKLSYDHQSSGGFAGGEYDGVGLELGWKRCPLYLSGWWRERGSSGWNGLADFDDYGVNLGYRWAIE